MKKGDGRVVWYSIMLWRARARDVTEGSTGLFSSSALHQVTHLLITLKVSALPIGVETKETSSHLRGVAYRDYVTLQFFSAGLVPVHFQWFLFSSGCALLVCLMHSNQISAAAYALTLQIPPLNFLSSDVFFFWKCSRVFPAVVALGNRYFSRYAYFRFSHIFVLIRRRADSRCL